MTCKLHDLLTAKALNIVDLRIISYVVDVCPTCVSLTTHIWSITLKTDDSHAIPILSTRWQCRLVTTGGLAVCNVIAIIINIFLALAYRLSWLTAKRMYKYKANTITANIILSLLYLYSVVIYRYAGVFSWLSRLTTLAWL